MCVVQFYVVLFISRSSSSLGSHKRILHQETFFSLFYHNKNIYLLQTNKGHCFMYSGVVQYNFQLLKHVSFDFMLCCFWVINNVFIFISLCLQLPVCFQSVRTWVWNMHVHRIWYMRNLYWIILNQLVPVFVCSYSPQNTPARTAWLAFYRIHHFFRYPPGSFYFLLSFLFGVQNQVVCFTILLVILVLLSHVHQMNGNNTERLTLIWLI